MEESCTERNPFMRMILTDFENLFVLGDPPEYEPDPATSVAATAKRENRAAVEVVLETLCANNGKDFFYYPLSTYAEGDFGAAREMLVHPLTTASLSDGGAHVGTVCDASVTTYMLTHWTRDRCRGPRIPVEEVIRKQTSEPAQLYGFSDRGVLAVGKKADINVIDFEGLTLETPYMAYDLPKQGRRLLQKARGYDYTIASGVVIAEDGELTGDKPGSLLRGPQGGQTEHAFI